MRSRGAVKYPKPTGYMTKIIDQHIAKVVDERDAIVVPHATQKVARAKGTPIDIPKVVSEGAIVGRPAPTPFSASAVMEVQEELLGIVQGQPRQADRQMRSDGYTQAEIGRKCSLPQSRVSERIKAIGKRLVQRCPEYRQYVVRDEDGDD